MARIDILNKSQAFAERYGLTIPILLAPMAGACPPALSIAVAGAGGMGACGALLMDADAIASWVNEFRAATAGSCQLNTWIPDPEPIRDSQHEARVCAFLAQWGPEVTREATEKNTPDFQTQCEAMLEARPTVMSSIMGLYPAPLVTRMKSADIAWFATVTTVNEARAAEAAGADVVVAQGMEAGGHRGTFVSEDAESSLVGLLSLLPAVVDAVDIPVIATGGIADARGASAAFMLGASAVQIGSGFLRAPEAGIATAWSAAMSNAAPEHTVATRAFSGRLGRSLRTRYVEAATALDAPQPAPYPVQRNLTAPMRTAAIKNDQLDGMQVWAGQSASLARADPAGTIAREIWTGTQEMLG